MLLKICGVTTIDAVKAADGVDYIGFVCGSPRSHRNLDLEEVENLVSQVRLSRVVGVTVSSSRGFLHRLQEIVDVIQLHGPARSLRRELIGPVAAAVSPLEDIPNRLEYAVLDAHGELGYGGSGKPWGWFRRPSTVPVLVAGGIGVHNLNAAVEETCADGVDVSSSLEIDGVKDVGRIMKLRRLVDEQKTI